ncbi:FdrA family protein [Marinitenerispora sediminis]|uniref:FdrA family protein n=3 Tax=Marinitenerispora sediminis TaxID=1931232 RepID=A0A368T0N5_9ACTN|nr:FdrA family protein [Marinitenerispora sediminis]RCV53155.1 FdrA family protein [Marinitenerispora sediminis]
MRVSRTVAALDGVRSALVAMATELNLELLADMGGAAPDGVGPNDLLVAVCAEAAEVRASALRRADDELAAMAAGAASGGSTGEDRPRTVRTAAGHTARGGRPATVALVAVPGPYAAAEAFDALEAGLDVLVFSDNVPVEHEIALKDAAARLGRLVMGPDCGTAVVGGAGLGFANAVRPGPVGVVAASGTGAQQLMCLLDAAGVGISHCLGVGGRDLSAAVAGRSTRQALRMLDADPATERIVLVSKPPAPEVAAAIEAECAALATPVHPVLLGASGRDIGAAAAEVLAALGRPAPDWPRWSPERPPAPRPGGALRGLFCGGTLADEAMLLASASLGPIASNIPLRPGDPAWTLPADLRTDGHLVVDFGDDTLTAGRPHPMIDPAVRDERVAAELADPRCGVLLLDVVCGHGAHPDPAAGVAAALHAAHAAGYAPPVVVSLCGTADDPQGTARQAEALASAGAEVFLCNAEAARRAVELLGSG